MCKCNSNKIMYKIQYTIRRDGTREEEDEEEVGGGERTDFVQIYSIHTTIHKTYTHKSHVVYTHYNSFLYDFYKSVITYYIELTCVVDVWCIHHIFPITKRNTDTFIIQLPLLYTVYYYTYTLVYISTFYIIYIVRVCFVFVWLGEFRDCPSSVQFRNVNIFDIFLISHDASNCIPVFYDYYYFHMTGTMMVRQFNTLLTFIVLIYKIFSWGLETTSCRV